MAGVLLRSTETDVLMTHRERRDLIRDGWIESLRKSVDGNLVHGWSLNDQYATLWANEYRIFRAVVSIM